MMSGENNSCCCSSKNAVSTEPVKIAPEISLRDAFKHFLLRLGIGRYKSKVKPGIYSIGEPSPESPLFVSANFTMSFDKLRAAIRGIDAYILVIDTKGINVWCAAGKGTFGSDEIISRVRESKITDRIKHRTLILPLLGAPGCSYVKIKKETGFRIVYGPVYASDIKAFLSNGLKTTPQMRNVGFTLFERLALIPMEFFPALKYLFYALIYIYLIHLIYSGFSFSNAIANSLPVSGALLMSLFTGCILAPAVITWLPFRSFTLKGALLGLFGQAVYLHFTQSVMTPLEIIGSFFVFTAFSAYLTFNFTGSTTFTNPSGVKKEMRLFLRPIILMSVIGAVLITLGCFGVA